MRRTIVLAVLVGIALVAVPMAGMGDPFGFSGGRPTGVFMNVDTPESPFQLCPEDPVGTQPVNFGSTTVEIDQTSHVLAYFTATWSGIGKETELVWSLQLEGDEFFAKSGDWIAQGGSQGITIHTTGTVMWAFENVGPGTYSVHPTVQVAGFQGAVNSGDEATLHTCALSAFVIPVAA